MGTSGAYGGSTGMSRVRQQTQNWLDSGGGAGGGDSQPPPPEQPPGPPNAPPVVPPLAPPSVNPALTGIVAALARTLATGGPSGGGGGTGGGGSRSGGGGTGGGGGRSQARASSAGGRALGGAWGTRTGNAAAVAELGLNLGELQGLSKYQQAQRILDAAMGPRGDVLDSEMRQANASVVVWALTEPVEPTPAEMATRWVVEYVWEAWVTEAGPGLQERCHIADERIRAEQEMRAALEALVAAHGLPDDRSLTSADFTTAIEGALGSLRRISGGAA